MLKYIEYGLSEAREKKIRTLMEEEAEKLVITQKGDPRYSDSLGWLKVDEWANDEILDAIEALAAHIQKKADAFVLIGVGGSNNSARSVIAALKKPGFPEIIYAGNTLSAHALQEMLAKLEGKDFYIDCIAKNFETLEPGSSFRILRRALRERYGEKANEHIIATGTVGSTLEELCRQEGYTFLEFPLNIGGRYTAMTTVSFLPMAVAGIDIRSLVRGAGEMETNVRSADWKNNIAWRYACLRNVMYREGCRVEMLSSFEPQFHCFFYWWTQLFAESEGKDNKGLFPVTGEFSEQLHSIGQFIQDGSEIMFESFLTVKNTGDSLVIRNDGKKDYFDYLDDVDFDEINEKACRATIAAHASRFPCTEFSVDTIDSYHFGQLFYFYAFACALSCRLMGVNAFDQPGVEEYKVRMFQALGK